MNELVTKWVQALRSGTYKQGYGMMRYTYPGRRTVFCCLGVLCEVAELPMSNDYYCFSPNGESRNILPDNVWFEAETGFDLKFMGELSKANDSLVYNFNDIADMIEAKANG
jgi:hypothetical protein